VSEEVIGFLALLKLPGSVEDERFDERLRLLPTGFPNGFDGQAA
jgi:hypothetical protein